ncbi:haloacid dehalogenase type II [Limnohabitans sp. TS-CS-82]|uniref:haloacid dehalogenase type II n=1 Tax=Limnohabitans sp. TS-CS-82 TaxID=2094193 RepID=UPI000CF2A7FF|nr:haloacid dehalogenase type II [Limnohabitans sp. TS-CS-82]PQA82165.1 haloacid dehalogenase type II [Limnohabitans sp. TS-CS-82]
MAIQAVVFDAYGTLFDVYSIGALAERLYPGQGAAISVLWRDKQIEYSRLITMSDPHATGGSKHYQSFFEVTRAALQYTLARLHLAQSAANEGALMRQYAHLTAFPENVGVLETLKAQGIPTAILSNGSPDMLNVAVTHAGMSTLIDHIISVDSVRQFKTSPESYGLVQQVLPYRLDEILFASSNAWDALGATWFGFQTLWVNRQSLPHETIGPKPTVTGRDLTDVLAFLKPMR